MILPKTRQPKKARLRESLANKTDTAWQKNQIRKFSYGSSAKEEMNLEILETTYRKNNVKKFQLA